MLTRAKRLTRRALITVLYPHAAFRTRRSDEGGQPEIRRILVARPDHLGDLLFATPALERLRKAFPTARITGLVGPWGRAMWEDNPYLNSLETLYFSGIAGGRERGGLGPYMLLGQAGRKLEHRRYDLAIVLRFDHWWGAALAAVASIPHKWGYATPGMEAWLTDAVTYVPGRHEVEQNLYLVEEAIRKLASKSRVERLGPLRINRDEGVPPLRPPSLEPIHSGLPASWLNAGRRAIIHPGTGAANKLWTIRGWAEVADRLSREGWAVILTGSPDEGKLVELIHGASESKPANLAGRTANLNQLTWLLDRAGLVLGVDSGPLHIAAALGKPTIHLYGPSDETIWGPWGNPRRHRALRAPGTRPSMSLDVGSTELEGGPEMRAITVEMVLVEVGQLTLWQHEKNKSAY